MSKTIGSAADFYRLRVTRMDTTEAADFEWRDDILYRRPPSDDPEEDVCFCVEAVLLDDEEVVVSIGRFDDRQAAYAWLGEREAELDEMTKSEFEAAYFTGTA